jgi:hypothetical protein
MTGQMALRPTRVTIDHSPNGMAATQATPKIRTKHTTLGLVARMTLGDRANKNNAAIN